MTFETLQIGSIEKPLADWGISSATRELTNQCHDHFACDMLLPADAADPIPYGTQIILRIGRIAANSTTPAGLPAGGLTSFAGGQTWFVGWRVETFHSGSPQLEKLDFKFAGPWEFFFERTQMRQVWPMWNGTSQVLDYRTQIILGQSVATLSGVNDTIAGTVSTNLMSIAQVVKMITGYCLQINAGKFQCDPLTVDSAGNFNLLATPGTNTLIPDYIAGVYAVAGPSGQTGATADMQTVLRAPLDAVNDLTCAECLRRMLKWIGPMGDAVIWFDYTALSAGAPCPMLKISTRDQLAAVDIPWATPGYAGTLAGPAGPMALTSCKIKRRDDLIPPAIDLMYRVTSRVNGVAYTQVIHDIAAQIAGAPTGDTGNVPGGLFLEGIGLPGALYTIQTFATSSHVYVGGAANSDLMKSLQTSPLAPQGVGVTIDFEGESVTTLACTIATVPVDTSSPNATTNPGDYANAQTFWKAIFPELNDYGTDLDLFAGTTVTIVDAKTGAAIDTGTFKYLLTRGQVASWMLGENSPSGVPMQSVNAVITAQFQGTENANITGASVPGNHSAQHIKHASITLVSLPGLVDLSGNPGPYILNVITGAAEVVPYGLAGYIYNIARIPQYEGSLTIQENEITDQCPMGFNLNIIGGPADWSAMNAMVTQASYDLINARTTLTFGPAPHLTAKDFVERLRVNRGPRSYYMIGGNMNNSGGGTSSLGNDVAKADPAHGSKAADKIQLPVSLTDLAAHSYPYGTPGISIESRPTGRTNYGDLGFTAPSIYLATGSAGTVAVYTYVDGAGNIVISNNSGGLTGPGYWTIQIAASDIPSGFGDVLKIREWKVCASDGTNAYALFLSSAPYTPALTGSPL